MHTDSWHGLYREGWGSRLRPASFAHPAKNSYGLSVRIYEHALEEGWIEPGQTVLDPFAGIGGFALEAMRHGLHFVGCELEMRFVDMGQGCDCTGIGKEDWARFQGRWDKMRYEGARHWCPGCLARAGAVTGEREFKPLPLPGSKWAAIAKAHQPAMFDAVPSSSYARNSGKIPCTVPHHYRGNIETWERQGMLGSAVIVQGDSRRLGEVLEEANLCLSSPPYAGSDPSASHVQGYSRLDPSSSNYRPFAERSIAVGYNEARSYGSNPANLGNLPDTGFEAACLPEHRQALAEQGYTVAPKEPQSAGEVPQATLSQLEEAPSEAQEGAEQPVLALSSPVYHSNTASDDPDKRGGLYRDPRRRSDKTLTATYSKDEAQLAQMPEGDLVLAISSPPFLAQSGGTNVTAGSGPLADASLLRRHSAGNKATAAYGIADGQLAALPEGDHAEACERPVCCISSPPWESSIGNAANTPETKMVRPKLPNANEVAAYLKQKRIEKGLSLREVDDYLGTVTLYSWYEGRPAGTQIPTPGNWRKLKALLGLDDRFDSGILTVEKMRATSLNTVNKTGHFQMTDYGKSKSQLAQMPTGDHAAAAARGRSQPVASEAQQQALEAGAETGRAQACISLPPFENVVNTKDQKYVEEKRLFGDYGDTIGQLGQRQGATFWAASREILEQVYQVLAPGGHAIFVCKRFVQSKKIVEFPLQWARLCEAVGFTWIHHHKARLVEDRGAQHTLEGGLEKRQVKRLSFFRRLHSQKYPHLAILWEDVLCFVKEAK